MTDTVWLGLLGTDRSGLQGPWYSGVPRGYYWLLWI